MLLVLVADDAEVFGNPPVDGQVWIVEQYAAIGFGMIEIIAFIGKDSLLAQDGKAMCKTFGDEELALVLFGQFDAEPLSESRALPAQVNGHVKHPSDGAADEFGLRERRPLEMKSAHYAVTGAGLVVLDKNGVDAGVAVAFLVVGLDEISACILEHLRFDNQKSFNRCFDDVHGVFSKKRAKVQKIFELCKKKLNFFYIIYPIPS